MIAIISAMPEELECIRADLSTPKVATWAGGETMEGSLWGKHVVLALSGVGKALAAMTVQHIADRFRPSALLFTGLAGALNPNYQIGDIVLARDCLQHDLDAITLGFSRGEVPYTGLRILNADEKLLLRASTFQGGSLNGTKCQVHLGRVLTGDQFISHQNRSSLSYSLEDLQGDAIEMEGASVALVATLHKIPFLLIRTISDRADGSATKDFAAFLPIASQQSRAMLKHLLADD